MSNQTMHDNPSDFKPKDLEVSDRKREEVGALAEIVENKAPAAELKAAATVPDYFRELHPDLKSRGRNLVMTFGPALLFCTAIALAMLIPGDLAWRNYQAIGTKVTGFVLLILASLGLLYAQRLGKKSSLYASWVFKTVEPIEMEVLVSTYEMNTDAPCYKRVFTFKGAYAQEVETYLEIDRNGRHFPHLGYSIEPRQIKLKVYFDPQCRAAIAAEDWHGNRYWLQPKGNKWLSS